MKTKKQNKNRKSGRRKEKMPRQYAFCKFNNKKFAKKYDYPSEFQEGEALIFLGEIPNMPGHCVVIAHRSGKIYSCYHTDHFIEMTDEEV